MSDELLEHDQIARARAGDRQALAELLLVYYDDLQRAVTMSLGREPHEATAVDDILQQVFIRAARGIERFEERTPGSFRAWLQTIAGNLVRDAQKRRRRERRALPGPELAGRDHPSSAAMKEWVADLTSPSRHCARRERAQQMLAALQELPSEQREAIQRHYLDHQSLDEVAAAMCRTKDAVRGICYRARQNLKTLLGNSSRYFSN